MIHYVKEHITCVEDVIMQEAKLHEWKKEQKEQTLNVSIDGKENWLHEEINEKRRPRMDFIDLNGTKCQNILYCTYSCTHYC